MSVEIPKPERKTAKFKDFKEILQDCVDNKCFMIWR